MRELFPRIRASQRENGSSTSAAIDTINASLTNSNSNNAMTPLSRSTTIDGANHPPLSQQQQQRQRRHSMPTNIRPRRLQLQRERSTGSSNTNNTRNSRNSRNSRRSRQSRTSQSHSQPSYRTSSSTPQLPPRSPSSATPPARHNRRLQQQQQLQQQQEYLQHQEYLQQQQQQQQSMPQRYRFSERNSPQPPLHPQTHQRHYLPRPPQPPPRRTGTNTSAAGSQYSHYSNNVNSNNMNPSSNHSQRSGSTVAMSTTTGNTVPTFVHPNHSTSLSRASDDETSWMSGIESHANNSQATISSSHHYRRNNNQWRDARMTKRIIDDLARARDAEEVMSALSSMCVEFNHDDANKHNTELYCGAVAVLAYTLSITDQTNHDAIRLISACMEMCFRGGPKYVKEAFRVNASKFMSPLLRLLDRCEQSKVRYADEIILNISKIFQYLSRVPELRLPLARIPGVLDSLQRTATTRLDVFGRNVRVRIMANLANCDDNKVLMFAHKGLLACILTTAQYEKCDDTREYATLTLMDLASAPANQIPLAKTGSVLKLLTTMVVTEKIPAIRESAITTLQNLAFPKSNRQRLVGFHDGIVLDALMSVMMHEPNEKARRRAAGALTNLSCDETAQKLACHEKLLHTLAHVALADSNEDVKQRSCLALTKIASSIPLMNQVDPPQTSNPASEIPSPPVFEQHEYFGSLMDALIQAADTSVETNISAVFRLRARQPECRQSMANHPKLLDTLANFCLRPQSSLRDRDNATRALMHLTNENINRKIMVTDRILEALVVGAACNINSDAVVNKSNGPDNIHLVMEIQDSAVRAIARLATEVSNRPILARHKGLITAMARATERECKLEDKGGGLSGGHQHHDFLGKPLLLTLLMAI